MRTNLRRRLRVTAVAALPSAALLAAGILASAGPAQAASTSDAAVAGTEPAWVAGATDTGPARLAAQLSTQVYLAGDSAGLAAYAQAVSSSASPDYQHFLTPAQVNARFGATGGQVAAVEGWLRASGLRIRRVSSQQIDASGDVANAERAYGTPLNEYRTSAGTFRAPAADVRMPAAVARSVLGVTGLDNRPLLVKPAGLVSPGPITTNLSGRPRPESTGSDGATFLGPTPCSAYYGQLADAADPPIGGAHQPYAICGYVPDQLRGAYSVGPAETGRGRTVAIVDAYGSPTLESDADTYAVNHGGQAFAAGQFTETVTPAEWTNQAACGGSAGWASEQGLDIEAVHGMAPAAAIHYYGANSCLDADFLDTLNTIVNTRSASIVSDSWGEVIFSSAGNEPSPVIAEYSNVFAGHRRGDRVHLLGRRLRSRGPGHRLRRG